MGQGSVRVIVYDMCVDMVVDKNLNLAHLMILAVWILGLESGTGALL